MLTFLLFGVIGVDDALILGSLMAGGTALGSFLGKKSSKDQAKLNYKYSLMMAENGPSASVKGLRKAGLNPILAATDGSFSSPQMPSVSAPQAGTETGMAMANLALNTAQTESNVDLQKTQQGVNESAETLNRANAFKSFTDGITKLSTGGLSGGYAALHSLGTKLGFGKQETSDILKSFGFGSPSGSAPDGTVKPPTANIRRNAPDDGKTSVSIPSHGPYDSKHYTGSRTGSWRADMNRKRKYNQKMESMLKQSRYERWKKYDESFERMPNVRRSIYR